MKGKWRTGVLKQSFMDMPAHTQVAFKKSQTVLGGRPCYWLMAPQLNLICHVAEELGGAGLSRMVGQARESINQEKLEERATRLLRNSFYWLRFHAERAVAEALKQRT